MTDAPEAATSLQFLLEDESFLLNSRGVIQLTGDQALQALAPLTTKSLNNAKKSAVLAYTLTEAGKLFADLFIVPHEDSLLIDCPRCLIPDILQQLSPHCSALDVKADDVSSDWRVFGELPDQTTYNDGSLFINYKDPRWHMGARTLRPRTECESSRWGHEIKWRAHAYKLGVLPTTELLQKIPADPLEANLQAFNLLDSKYLKESLKNATAESIPRRILPMRVEPNFLAFATMSGLEVTADKTAIGTVLGHHGLYALVLCELSKWREAVLSGHTIMCAQQQVLINWPSWLASESGGRMGPAAAKKF